MSARDVEGQFLKFWFDEQDDMLSIRGRTSEDEADRCDWIVGKHGASAHPHDIRAGLKTALGRKVETRDPVRGSGAAQARGDGSAGTDCRVRAEPPAMKVSDPIVSGSIPSTVSGSTNRMGCEVEADFMPA